MEEEKNRLVSWVKEHKKELIITGIGIGTLITIILGIKNRDSLVKTWDTLKAAVDTEYRSGQKIVCNHCDIVPVHDTDILPKGEATEKAKIIRDSFEVDSHIRNLHPGWNASAKKLAEAETLGIVLLPGQTLVDKYTKRGAVA
ncbi:MAG: hypothetical protein K2M91_04495 [Lachnospiraceae bacterium]|nr:hypothetical protein [Lachnospiraceae bacterium]